MSQKATTIEEMKNIILNGTQTADLKSDIEEAFSLAKNKLDVLLRLAETIMKRITIIIQKNKSAISYSLETKNKNFSEGEEESLMTLLGQWDFLAREFITEEQIDFDFGYKSKDSDWHFEQRAIIPQNEVLKKFTVLKDKTVGVKIAVQQELINAQLNKQSEWKVNSYKKEYKFLQVEKLAEVKGKGSSVRAEGKKINGHQLYQKIAADRNVFFYWTKGQNSRFKREYYYQMERDSYQYYNFGWLYEWYNAIYEGDNGQLLNWINNDLDFQGDEGQLYLLFLSSKRDTVKALDDGDYRTASGNAVQAKYNNAKIISYNQILQKFHEYLKLLTTINNVAQEGEENIKEKVSKQNMIELTAQAADISLEKRMKKLLDKNFKDKTIILK